MERKPSGLATLFTSLGKDLFLAKYWPERPTWSHGRISRLSKLRDLETLSGVLTLTARSRIEMKAVLRGTLHETNEIPILSGPSGAITLYDGGATIVCNSVERWHSGVDKFRRSLSRELGLPPTVGVCNLYMSPTGAGLPMHFDDHEIIVVQLAGRKRWRIAKNTTLTNPTSNSGPFLVEEVARYASKRSVKRMPAGNTIEMSPGSALFLPRGYWHKTDARESSISLTFGFSTPCWAELVRDFLRQRLVEQVEWREPVWNAWKKGGVSAATERRWREMSEEIAALLASTKVSDLIAARNGNDLTP
jgi:50S ribosomal protein L16 3-hydroxylase